jgi:hypothetical protein
VAGSDSKNIRVDPPSRMSVAVAPAMSVRSYPRSAARLRPLGSVIITGLFINPRV